MDNSQAMGLAPDIIMGSPEIFSPASSFPYSFPSKEFRCPRCSHTVYLWWAWDTKKWIVRPMGLCRCFGKDAEWANDAAGLIQALIWAESGEEVSKPRAYGMLMGMASGGRESAWKVGEERAPEDADDRLRKAAGHIQRDSRELDAWLSSRGIERSSLPRETLDHMGYLKGLGHSDGPCFRMEQSANGKPCETGIEARCLTGRQKALCHGKKGAFLLSEAAKEDILYAFEGPADALSALSLGLRGSFATMGCTNGRAILSFLRDRRPRRLMISLDDDEAGWKGAERLRAEIASETPWVDAYILPCSAGSGSSKAKDLNELLMRDRDEAERAVRILKGASIMAPSLGDEGIEKVLRALENESRETVLVSLRERYMHSI